MNGAIVDGCLNVVEDVHYPRMPAAEQDNVSTWCDDGEGLAFGNVVLDPAFVEPYPDVS